MQIQMLFGKPIYLATDIVSEEVHEKCIARALHMRSNTESAGNTWDCNVYTSINDGDLFEDSEFYELHQAIAKHVSTFANEFVEQPQVVPSSAWFNISGETQYQESHIHANSHFSAVYYMRAPEGSAPTAITEINKRMLLMPRQRDNMLNAEATYIPATERAVLIFPSFMPHHVAQGTNTKERITHASNWSIQ